MGYEDSTGTERSDTLARAGRRFHTRVAALASLRILRV
jgi:hypothetical protein